MTIGDNVPIADSDLIVSEMIEQYLEDKRQAQIDYERALAKLFAEADCDQCEEEYFAEGIFERMIDPGTIEGDR